jgi:hypothetical protein
MTTQRIFLTSFSHPALIKAIKQRIIKEASNKLVRGKALQPDQLYLLTLRNLQAK